jgi:hypothetical protein
VWNVFRTLANIEKIKEMFFYVGTGNLTGWIEGSLDNIADGSFACSPDHEM